MWSLGSRALRTEGAIDSKFGAELGPSPLPKYAHHPPLIYSAIAATELVSGERPFAARLPSVISSVGFIFLAYFLLREMNVDPLAAALGVTLFVASPMFLVYGAMADTAMVGLPFGALALLLWRRHRSGKSVPPTLMALTAVAACLASWQALAVAVLLSALSLWHMAFGRRRREAEPGPPSQQERQHERQRKRLDRQRETSAVALCLGTLLGFVLVFAWVHWVYGSFDALSEVSAGRMREGSDFGMSFQAQVDNIRALIPLSYVVIPLAAVAALWPRATRDVGVIMVAVVVGYGLFFWSGAFIHDYWNYWILLPSVIGAGIALDRLARWPLPRVWPFVASVAVLALLYAGLGQTQRSPARRAAVAGRLLGRELASASWPDAQRYAYYEGEISPMPSYYSGLPPRRVTRAKVDEYCRQPDFLVVDVNGLLRRCSDLRK